MDFATVKSGLEVFTSAIGAVKALIGVSGSTKDIEVVKQKMGDVLTKLGEARERYIALQDDYIAVVEENRQLKIKLAENVEGEPCPRCHRKGWRIESSELDREFGIAGISRSVYKCEFCGFSETKLTK